MFSIRYVQALKVRKARAICCGSEMILKRRFGGNLVHRFLLNANVITPYIFRFHVILLLDVSHSPAVLEGVGGNYDA